jgi:putative transposase
LIFDPFDLTDIEVRLDSRPMGKAVAYRIARHSHPAAKPDPTVEPVPSTGIDYLRLVETRRDKDLAARSGIDYHQLSLPDELIPKPKTPDTDTDTDTDTEEDAR